MQTAKTDQTGLMPRLIWVFAGHICHFVGFLMWWLISKQCSSKKDFWWCFGNIYVHVFCEKPGFVFCDFELLCFFLNIYIFWQNVSGIKILANNAMYIGILNYYPNYLSSGKGLSWINFRVHLFIGSVFLWCDIVFQWHNTIMILSFQTDRSG